MFSAEADRLTDYLSWLGLLVGLAAIFLGVVSIQAIRQFAFAKRLAETESERAEVLEQAVAERTRELMEANEALRSRRRSGRRPKPSCARSRRWKRSAS